MALIDSSLLIRRNDSAIIEAILIWRIFAQAEAASESGMVSVTTSSSRADFLNGFDGFTR